MTTPESRIVRVPNWVWIEADDGTLVRADQIITARGGRGPAHIPGFEVSVAVAVSADGEASPVTYRLARDIASKEEAAAATVELLQLVASFHADGLAGVLRYDGQGWPFTEWDIP